MLKTVLFSVNSTSCKSLSTVYVIDTGNKKWGTPYLTRDFFNIIHERMPEKIVLMMCRNNGRYVAGALNFLGKDTLFGRHWGCIEEHDCLHFEVCYYQAIEFAIKNGLSFVEAGAQGSHKLQRGYMPEKTWSLHWIKNKKFKEAISHYLDEEISIMNKEKKDLEQFAPFKEI